MPEGDVWEREWGERKRELGALRTEPWKTWQNGFLAGLAGRTAVLPFDRGQNGMYKAVTGRGLQYAVLLGCFVPLARESVQGTDQRGNPPTVRVAKVFWCGAVSSYLMRLCTNPLGRIRDEVRITRDRSPVALFRFLKIHPLSDLWRNRHPFVMSSIHVGATFGFFAPLRHAYMSCFFRGLEQSPEANAAANGLAGLTGSAMASTLLYPFSQQCYLSKLKRTSMLTIGVVPAVMKEAPMFGVALATFSLLQSYSIPLSEDGVHAGLGY